MVREQFKRLHMRKPGKFFEQSKKVLIRILPLNHRYTQENPAAGSRKRTQVPVDKLKIRPGQFLITRAGGFDVKKKQIAFSDHAFKLSPGNRAGGFHRRGNSLLFCGGQQGQGKLHLCQRLPAGKSQTAAGLIVIKPVAPDSPHDIFHAHGTSQQSQCRARTLFHAEPAAGT